MNHLYLVVTSNLVNVSDFIRFMKSVDINKEISVLFVNQSDGLRLQDVYKVNKCQYIEYQTKRLVPLSVARNIALKDMYENELIDVKKSIVMFVDDDAWFPYETIQMLLGSEIITAKCLRTIDPETRKSFNGLSYTDGEVKGWHLIHDICSICLVLPYKEIYEKKLLFNEHLGLGNEISQGEESLFIYNLTRNGLKIYYDEHYIYHPYKCSNNMKNYYSMSYFWSWGLFHVSPMFLYPCLKYLTKYSVGLVLCIKNKKYLRMFVSVWKGAFDEIGRAHV